MRWSEEDKPPSSSGFDVTPPTRPSRRRHRKPRGKSSLTEAERAIFSTLFEQLGGPVTSENIESESATSAKEGKSGLKQIARAKTGTRTAAEMSDTIERILDDLKTDSTPVPMSYTTLPRENATENLSEPNDSTDIGEAPSDPEVFVVHHPEEDFEGPKEEPARHYISETAETVALSETESIKRELRNVVEEGKSDLAVWKVCEERIFGFLREHDQEPASGRDSEGHHRELRRTRDKKIQLPGNDVESRLSESSVATDLDATRPCELDIPPEVSRTAVIAAILSLMLPFVIKLLRKHFPDSPLIGEIRPAIKSHGRAAIVLAASTRLYNELIRFHWKTQDDLATVVELLKEMESTGTEPDPGTLAIVRGIVSQRKEEKQKYGRKMTLRIRRLGPDAGDVRWVDTEPNNRALRELQGSPTQSGWIQWISTRLEDIEHRKVDEDSLAEREEKTDLA